MAGEMERERHISRVLELASQSLTLEDLGAEVLPALRRLIHADKLLLYRSQDHNPFYSIAGDVECLPEYTSEIAHRDPLQSYMKRFNPLYFSGTQSPGWSEVQADRAIADFYDRWELSRFFHMRLTETNHMEAGHVAVVCGRSSRQSDFEAADLHAVSTVLPALQAAVRRSGRMALRLSSTAAIEALFSRQRNSAILALDINGTLLWMSPRAEKLLAWKHTGEHLPDSIILAAKKLGLLSRGLKNSCAASGAYHLRIRNHENIEMEGEAYLAKMHSGETFVVVDFGGTDIPPCLIEVAKSHGLTRTETEVLADLAQGRADSEIASHRYVSVATVRTHVTRIIGKLGASSRLRAVAIALGTAQR